MASDPLSWSAPTHLRACQCVPIWPSRFVRALPFKPPHRRLGGMGLQPAARRLEAEVAGATWSLPPARDGGRFTKVTDRKLFVIERQERRSAPRQINHTDPAEALRSAPDASVCGGSPSRCCLASMPLVCETASTKGSRLGGGAPGIARHAPFRCGRSGHEIGVGAGCRSHRQSGRSQAFCALADCRLLRRWLVWISEEVRAARVIVGGGSASCSVWS